jgi:AcrR family transcriptional regulator
MSSVRAAVAPGAPPRARRTQRERRDAAELGLITAAAELISEIGPAAVTLAKVGERAGYSRGLAAHHFGAKAELMRRVGDAVSDEFRAALQAGLRPESSLLDHLRVLVSVYFDVVVDPPVLHRARLVLIADAVAHPSADHRDAVTDADRDFRSTLRGRIAAASDEVPDDLDPDAFTVALVGMLRGITFESMLDPSIDLRAAQREVDAFLTSRLSR